MRCIVLQDRVKFHVLLTTYEILSRHLQDIKRLQWSVLVVDEAHRLKSAASKLFQVCVGGGQQLGWGGARIMHGTGQGFGGCDGAGGRRGRGVEQLGWGKNNA